MGYCKGMGGSVVLGFGVEEKQRRGCGGGNKIQKSLNR